MIYDIEIERGRDDDITKNREIEMDR